MEIVGPVLGFGSIIMSIATGIVLVRWGTSKIRQQELRTRPASSDQLVEDVQARLGELDELKERMVELEERVDFAERLLAKPHEGPRLGSRQG